MGRLATPEEREKSAQLVAGFDERDGIESQAFFWIGAAMLIAFIAVIATTPVLPLIRDLGMGYVAMAFGAIMLLRFKAVADKFYQAID